MTLSEENAQVLNLVQAMIGGITPNMRRIVLRVPRPNAVRLTFVLEQESEPDREDIDDIAFEFEALQSADIDLDVEVVVDSRPIAALTLSGRVVFGRKERGP